jgi:polyhydroxyalkanoate synthesis regulator phasin
MDERVRGFSMDSEPVDRSVQTDARAEPARPDVGTASGALRQAGLALLGAVALTAERADELAESLAERGGMRKDEVRGWIEDATSRWRGDALRVGERAGETLRGALHELGLVTRDEWDELELRVAQLEHRLRLLESGEPTIRNRSS